MAAGQPHLSSAFQAERKRRAKWQEIFPKELLPFYSGMKTFRKDFMYFYWPEIHYLAIYYYKGWEGSPEKGNVSFLDSIVELDKKEWGYEWLLSTYRCLLVAIAGSRCI